MMLKDILKREKGFYILYLVSLLLDVCTSLWIANLLQRITDAILEANRDKILSLILESGILLIAIMMISIMAMISESKYKKNTIISYRKIVFHNLVNKRFSEFEKSKTSQYLSGVTNDVQSIEENYLLSSATICSTIFMSIGAIALMIHYSLLLTFVTIVLMMIPIIISITWGKKVENQERNISQANSFLVSKISNYLQGIQVIKSFQSENHVEQLFNDVNKETENEKYKRKIILGSIETIASCGGFVAQIGVFLFGAYLSIYQKSVTAGMLMAFVNLVGSVISPISKVPVLLANRKGAAALIDKMQKEIGVEHAENTQTQRCEEFQWPIRLNSISFGYTQEQPILSNISFQLEKGKKYALLGNSGSGKSTLLELIMGTLIPNSGELRLGNVNYCDVSQTSMLNAVSYILQSAFLFDGTLKHNITMFKDYDEELVLDAIEKAGLLEFYRLHGGDYILKPEDENISGGEKQRISIARAILKKSELIIGDEITSSLDINTSQAIFNTITGLSDVTVLLVTHNLDENVLSLFDELIVIKNGKVEEIGDYETLINKRGYLYYMKTLN